MNVIFQIIYFVLKFSSTQPKVTQTIDSTKITSDIDVSNMIANVLNGTLYYNETDNSSFPLKTDFSQKNDFNPKHQYNEIDEYSLAKYMINNNFSSNIAINSNDKALFINSNNLIINNINYDYNNITNHKKGNGSKNKNILSRLLHSKTNKPDLFRNSFKNKELFTNKNDENYVFLTKYSNNDKENVFRQNQVKRSKRKIRRNSNNLKDDIDIFTTTTPSSTMQTILQDTTTISYNSTSLMFDADENMINFTYSSQTKILVENVNNETSDNINFISTAVVLVVDGVDTSLNDIIISNLDNSLGNKSLAYVIQNTSSLYIHSFGEIMNISHRAWPVKHSAVVEGDVILGGLMMVHSREDTITCGPIMPQGGIQALEVMLFTLDRINESGLLPNISLGAHILDDCDKDTYGLEMAVDFIKGEYFI